jgi:hypothetical protein
LPLAPFCSPNGLTSISAQSLIAGPPVIIERFVGTVGCPHQETEAILQATETGSGRIRGIPG